MATCNQCGEEIEFRYIGGRCVPIHQGGGWHCGSWSEPDYSTPAPRVSRSGEWRERDFTRPTHCPTCGADVFFIRHNGGSVWVDELGWPWPKHGCFDQPHEPTRAFSSWTEKSSGLTNPKLAIIKRLTEAGLLAEPVVIIEFLDSSRASLVMRHTPPTESLLGALVIVSVEDSLLLHQEHAEIAFHSFTLLPASRTDGYYTCRRCHAWVREDSGHEEYCRKRHPTPKPVRQSRPRSDGNTNRPAGAKAPRPATGQQGPAQNAEPSPALRFSAPTTEDRITEALDTVAKKAWATVARHEPPEHQLKEAKHEALRLVRMLSPSIKGQVQHRLTNDNWKRLRAWRPG